MDFTTKTLILFFCISMSSCSSDKGNVLDISKDTPIPKSSLADLNKNQTKNISQWDGRIKGCKSKQ